MAIKQLGISPSNNADTATKNYVDLRQIGARATSTLALSTTTTQVPGLTLTIPSAGTWIFRAHIPIVVVGTTNTNTWIVSPSGAPTSSAVNFCVKRFTATSKLADVLVTAFNTASGSATWNVSGNCHTIIEGNFVCTTSGTLSISGTKPAGTTSLTTQLGAYLLASRIA